MDHLSKKPKRKIFLILISILIFLIVISIVLFTISHRENNSSVITSTDLCTGIPGYSNSHICKVGETNLIQDTQCCGTKS